MLLRNGVDLKPFNTMALAAPAAHFVQAETDAQLREALLLALCTRTYTERVIVFLSAKVPY